VVRKEGEKKMHMWKASFLKLNGMYMGKDMAKNVLVRYVIQERIFEHIEHPHDQVRPICSRLTWKQFRSERFP